MKILETNEEIDTSTKVQQDKTQRKQAYDSHNLMRILMCVSGICSNVTSR